MSAKQKSRTPFLLKPYSKFDGRMLLIIFGIFLIACSYTSIINKNMSDMWAALLSGCMLLMFYAIFRIKYRWLLLKEDHILIHNWLGKTVTYPISQVKGYQLRQAWGHNGWLTTTIIIVTVNNEKISIDREYYTDDRLEKLRASFDRYGIQYLGYVEMKFKHKYLFEKISFWVYFIGGIGLSILIFLRHLKIMGGF